MTASPASPPDHHLPPRQALAVFLTASAAFLLFSPLSAPLGLAGLITAHLVAILAIPLVALRVIGAPMRASLGLWSPRAPAIVGAVAVGVSCWYLNLILVSPLAERVTMPGEMAELERTLLGPGVPLAVTLLASALVPAISEELLMRGVLLRSFLPSIGRSATIAATAVLFGVLHMSLARGITTAAFGVLLADVAIASGSVIPAMLVHGLNNAMAIAVATGSLAFIPAAHQAHPHLMTALAGALTLGGLVLVHGSGPVAGPRSVSL